jgi:predicted phosphodiesterase
LSAKILTRPEPKDASLIRIAVLADIHGNLPAFEAALAHVRRQGVDHIVIAGDLVTGAPDSHQCWQLAQTLDATLLRGNHERYVFDFDAPHAPPLWKTDRFGPVQWTVAQFSAAERRALALLPLAVRLPSIPDLLFVHASPLRDNDSVSAYTPGKELAAMYGDAPETVIVRGHDHLCQVRLWNGHTIVTSGSVGMPLDENPTAQYVILEQRNGSWSILHQSAPYDVDATVERFYSSGYRQAAGPMARLLLREIATASPQLVPFLRLYERWTNQEELALSAGVERYLTFY